MRWLDLTLPTLAENLALDEALLLQAEAEPASDLLRVWECPRPGVVLGISGKLAEEVHLDACRADGVPMRRRSSGGGSVLLGPGCLCYSLILRYPDRTELREIGCSYCYILGKLAAALAEIAPGIAPAGTSDLAWNGQKVSGNAQQRKRSQLLHHGTLLFDFDLACFNRYLKPPPRQPEYRAGRRHDAFVANLPADGSRLRQLLRQAWSATEVMEAWPQGMVSTLVAEKYGQASWNERR